MILSFLSILLDLIPHFPTPFYFISPSLSPTTSSFTSPITSHFPFHFPSPLIRIPIFPTTASSSLTPTSPQPLSILLHFLSLSLPLHPDIYFFSSGQSLQMLRATLPSFLPTCSEETPLRPIPLEPTKCHHSSMKARCSSTSHKCHTLPYSMRSCMK